MLHMYTSCIHVYYTCIHVYVCSHVPVPVLCGAFGTRNDLWPITLFNGI